MDAVDDTKQNFGLDGNKLSQVWTIAHQFYLPFLRCAVNSTVNRISYDVHYNNHVTHINCTFKGSTLKKN